MSAGIEASARWPLSDDQRAHVVRLGELIPFNVVPLVIALLVGGFVRRTSFQCAACDTRMETELEVCPTCGVTLPETLATRAQQAARRAQFAEQAEAEDPELAAEAERAYHPDA